jgi:hypothetical protein
MSAAEQISELPTAHPQRGLLHTSAISLRQEFCIIIQNRTVSPEPHVTNRKIIARRSQ